MSRVWLVRISPYRQTSLIDFDFFEAEVKTHGTGLWDKDTKNHMAVGDYLGFIVGPTVDANVQVYRVTEQQGVEFRHAHWTQSPREVVILDGKSRQDISWNEWRREVGYSSQFWPNGTMLARKYPKFLSIQ